MSEELTPFEAIRRTNPTGNEFCSNQRLRQGARLRQLPSL